VGKDEFKKIAELKPGDTIFVLESGQLAPKIVTANVRVDEPTDAYNFSVDNTQTFFANDFAVHNKCWCGGCYDYDDKLTCCPHPDLTCQCKGYPKYDADNCIQGTHLERWENGYTRETGVLVTDKGCVGKLNKPFLWKLSLKEPCDHKCTKVGGEEDCWDTKWTVYAYRCVGTLPYGTCNYPASPSPGPMCTATAPAAPDLVTPTDGTIFPAGTNPVSLTWKAPASWGVACPETDKSYYLYII